MYQLYLTGLAQNADEICIKIQPIYFQWNSSRSLLVVDMDTQTLGPTEKKILNSHGDKPITPGEGYD